MDKIIELNKENAYFKIAICNFIEARKKNLKEISKEQINVVRKSDLKRVMREEIKYFEEVLKLK